MAQVGVDFALFCDDVRMESSGKYIIIGLYSNTLVGTLGQPGGPILLAMNLIGEPGAQFNVDVEVRQDNALLTAVSALDEFNKAGTNLGVIALELRPLTGDGMLEARIRLPGEEGWHPLRKMSLHVVPAPEQ